MPDAPTTGTATFGPAGEAAPPAWAPVDPDARYVDLGFLGEGAMGEVRRVHDTRLDCVVAMKVLAADRAGSPADRARFVAEANLTARLDHPGVVAVHDRGERPDGRLWYTMSEVRGRTFAAEIEAHHRAPSEAGLRRLVEALRRVCGTVAYAHGKGVFHRDLKPDNLMVGPFGEVLVMDWGVAGDAADRRVVGTPGYLAPEVFREGGGSPAADTFALGRVLAVALTGRPPGGGDDLEGAPPELARLCREATAADPAARLPSPAALGERLQRWLDGAERASAARALLADAEAARPAIQALRAEAAALRRRAEAALAALSPFAPPADKAEAWAAEDRSAALLREAALAEAAWHQRLGAVLAQADLPEAHAALADHYAAALRDAEERRAAEDVARFEAHLAHHDRGAHAALLRGEGAVTLDTDPPGAEVRALRYVARGRRLVPEFDRVLGVTPLRAAPLPRGSWRLELHHPDRAPVAYPVALDRGGAWEGVRPGDSAPTPVRLPRVGELGADEVLVAGGFFWSGGDPEAVEALPRRRLWVDPLVAKRLPVTVAEYTAWLQELLDGGDLAAATAHAPRSPTNLEAPRPPTVGPGGRIVPEAPGDHPVVGVPWTSATAYAAWRAARERLPWRLPDELEWEKAARGVDGRAFPMGDHLDPAWSNTLGAGDGSIRRLGPVGAVPADESPFGLRDLAGNARTFCGNAWTLEGPPVVDGVLVPEPAPPDATGLLACRGGSFTADARLARCATRLVAPPGRAYAWVGLRLVRSLPR